MSSKQEGIDNKKRLYEYCLEPAERGRKTWPDHLGILLEDENELLLHYRPIMGLPKKTGERKSSTVQSLRGALHYPLCVEKRVGHGFLYSAKLFARIVRGLQLASLEDQGEMIYGGGI